MKLVLDTNLLFSFFWKGSLIRKLLAEEHEVFSPEFALEELKKHKSEISKKARLSSDIFDEIIISLQDMITFIPFSEYTEEISEAFNLLPEHPKDMDFLALALYLNAALVSNDRALLKQSKVEIFNCQRFSELFYRGFC